MTNEQIDHLIAARNAITDRTDDYANTKALNHIDAVLRDIPVGQRRDVDALLGRRPGYIVNPAAQMLGWLVPDERGDGMGGNDPERCEAGGYG
jgi:hypothetical protein